MSQIDLIKQAAILTGWVSASQRVLVGNSVYEDAELTVYDGTLFIEFAAEDLEDVSLGLRAIGLIADP